MTDIISQVLSIDGWLASEIPNFKPRKQQIEMAYKVESAIKTRQKLIIEAGTGMGKTFAYLVPALVSGGKVILSTGTKTLQGQLFNRDLPVLRRVLKLPLTIALLKGRANYICHFHIKRAGREDRLYASPEEVHYLQKIRIFAEHSESGDRAEIVDVPDSAKIWSSVTSTRENCLGSSCEFYKDCFVVNARKKAQNADIIVVNHHLFFADVMLKDEGLTDLLPVVNTVIFDEAHQLAETATIFFGGRISTGQLLNLSRDVIQAFIGCAQDCPALRILAEKLEKNAKDFYLVLDQANIRKEGQEASTKLSAGLAKSIEGFDAGYGQMVESLQELTTLLENQAPRDPSLEACWKEAAILIDQLKAWQGNAPELIYWIEMFSHTLQFHATPLSIAEEFKSQMQSTCAWIFVSATLAVERNFSHYQQRMGLLDAETAFWESPFNYPEQSLLYVPKDMPNPNDATYLDRLVLAVLPVIQASRGRAFILSTSLLAMQKIHRQLKRAFEQEKLPYLLLCQGEMHQTELLKRFQQHGNAVLVASQSFWEGVDVRGSALSLVVIDRIPFAPPDDPVFSAHIDNLKAQNKNPFFDYQLPNAIISLKQGVGRLIRDETDTGILMICDPRLAENKNYRGKILRSLPPFKRTRDFEDVKAFFGKEENLG